MKKLSFSFLSLLLFAAFAVTGCNDDDKATIVLSFEGKLTEEETEFRSESTDKVGDYFVDSFTDNDKTILFPHSYAYWGKERSFSQFTYTNKTDTSTVNCIAAITEKGKVGRTYLCVYADELSPAQFTINVSDVCVMKGAWVTNCAWAYKSMIAGDAFAKKFEKGDWFMLTAIGYSAKDVETGRAEIYLANYKSDGDKPVNEWMWFDMRSLRNAVKVKFVLDSKDKNEWGMNTPAYFCMDGITLEEK